MKTPFKLVYALVACLVGGCTTQLEMQINTIPQGAKISSMVGQTASYSPTIWHYPIVQKSIDDSGCHHVVGYDVEWKSGAKTQSRNPIVLCGNTGSWQITIERPANYPGLETDLLVERAVLADQAVYAATRAPQNSFWDSEAGGTIGFALGCAIVGGCPKGSKPSASSRSTNHSNINQASSLGCSSDFGCGYGSRCVKAPASGRGICLKSEDPLRSPSLDSVRAGPLSGECSLSADCSIGYRCDLKLKACVK